MLKTLRILTLLCFCALVSAAASTSCQADATAESTRKIIESQKEAVVTLQLVLEIKSSYGSDSDKQQNKLSATGIVVDPSGLVISSLSAVNPAERYAGDEDYKVSSKILDANIKTTDGDEIPMDIVLRDRDLDLVFLKPRTAPDKPLPFLDLSQSASPQVMDEVLVLARLGQVGNRSIAASLDRVSAVITKPRTSYFLSGIAKYSLGSPAFTLDGKLIGMTVVRAPAGKDSEMSSAMDRMLYVTLPCSTLLNAAAQAKTASPEKPATEAPTTKPAEKMTPKARPPIKPAAKK